MNEVEALITDVVSAIAASLGASLTELEKRTKSNFRAPIAAEAISKLIEAVPANAANRKTVIAVYKTFASVLNGRPGEAPPILLRPAARPPAKPRTQPTKAKHSE